MNTHQTRVLGIDLAAQPRDTYACMVDPIDGGLSAVLAGACDDTRLLALADGCAKVAIDAPFGWPEDFVDALNAHREGGPWPSPPGEDPAARRALLRFRATDRVVSQTRPPLSVSTDRIGVTAMRCAHLLHLWSVNEPVDRTGSGRFVEVYPGGALRRWGLEPSGYKGESTAPLRLLLSDVRRALPSLRTDTESWELLAESHDAFDALVAALVARAALLGLTDEPPEGVRPRAAREGWIHLPVRGSLRFLDRNTGGLAVQPVPPLVERLGAEGVTMDSAGYVSRTDDVLLAGLHADARAAIVSDLTGKGGSELVPRANRKPKFWAAHSSAALAANAFGPFLGTDTELPLGHCVYTGAASLEVECPTDLPGTPPTLDLLVEGREVLGVESKLTEPFARHEARFKPAYVEAIKRLPSRWRAEYERLVEDPFRYRFLDAAQLVKHCLGLCTQFPDRRVTLAYVYWTPSNADEVAPCAIHDAELAEFADRVGDRAVRFVHLAYRDLWSEWLSPGRPDELRRHAAALRDRYDVPV